MAYRNRWCLPNLKMGGFSMAVSPLSIPSKSEEIEVRDLPGLSLALSLHAPTQESGVGSTYPRGHKQWDLII